ncbi:hypothetical protein WICPIJ_006906 [Wickerhamomyces pijperi]|uniref:Zn(2)-C6 fungal-type domain-containing protein n=1 Tax=Wickerhamomyces pijperi TaxID=599730 RepID=A0A9P8Q164_WICPI|nr:hypothetical protein WICPIJ_006906 [Wickerhamomyces pijperi]
MMQSSSSNDKEPSSTAPSSQPNNNGNSQSANSAANNNENLLHQSSHDFLDSHHDFLDSQSMQIFNATDKDFFNHYENMLRQNKISLNSNNNSHSNSPANNLKSPSLSQQSPLSISNAQNTGNTPSATNSNSLFKPQGNSGNNNNSNNTNNNSSSSSNVTQTQTQTQCDHCRRRQVECIVMPSNNPSGTTSCVQCQSKNLKCNFNRSVSSLKRGLSEDNIQNHNSPSNPTTSGVSNLQQQFLIQQQQTQTQAQSQAQNQQQQQQQQKRRKMQYPRSSFYIGDNNTIFDNFIFQNFPLDKVDQFKVDDTFNIRKVSHDVMFLLKDDYEENSIIRTDLALEEIENAIRPNGYNLVQLFFNKLHNHLPVLHKEVFLEKYSRSFKEFSPSLLGIVYLLALQFIPESKIPNKALIESKIYNLVMSTFNATIAKPRLSSIQSGLLILHYRIYYRNWDNNWNLIQQIVSIGENLGLGIDCQDWKLPKWERCLRRRLGWLLLIQEKWISVLESKISHIVIGRNFNLKVLTDADFNESDDRQSVEVFKNFIELTLILTEILEKFYNQLPSPQQTRNNFQTVLALAKPIQIQLRTWYQTMQASPVKYPNFLQFNYYICEIMLHRKIILNITNNPSSSRNSNDQLPSPKIPVELVKICKDAAKTRLLAVLKFLKAISTPSATSTLSDINSEYWHLTAVNNLYLVSTFSLILLLNSNEDIQSQTDMYNFGLGSANPIAGLASGLSIDEDLKKLIVEFREILASNAGSDANSPSIRFIQIARVKIELIFGKFEAVLNGHRQQQQQQQLGGNINNNNNQFNIYQTPGMFSDFNSPMPPFGTGNGSTADTPNNFHQLGQQIGNNNSNMNNFHSPLANNNNTNTNTNNNNNNNQHTPSHHSPLVNNNINNTNHSPMNILHQHQSPHS